MKFEHDFQSSFLRKEDTYFLQIIFFSVKTFFTTTIITERLTFTRQRFRAAFAAENNFTRLQRHVSIKLEAFS